MNKIFLKGRLGQDPELRYTQNNTAVATVGLAVNRYGKDAGTDWFNIVAWQSTGEFLSKYWKKGDEIIVIGRLQNREYTDRNNIKHKVTEVIASELEFCGSRKDSSSRAKREEDEDGFQDALDDSEDGLPFV